MAVTVAKTTCIMDCPDTCSLKVSVEEGKLVGLDGSSANDVTADFICGKVRNFGKRQYAPERLLSPKKRIGPKGSNQFEDISWDEAITTITDKFKQISTEFGGEAILPYNYGGSNGLLSNDFVDALYFARLKSSRCGYTLCAVPTGLVNKSMFGYMPSIAYQDFPEAKFILIWGTNPKNTSIHTIPYLKAAKKNGATIAVVDPFNAFSSNEIDMHIGLRPGTDLPLALAMIRYFEEKGYLDQEFLAAHTTGLEPLLEQARNWSIEKAAEECGLEATQIIQLCETYAQTKPALLRCGWGLERNTNGGQGVAAVMAMPSLLNSYGSRGGGFTMSSSKAISFDGSAVLEMPKRDTREINQSELADVLHECDGIPIKGLFVYNCNPVATVPHQNKLIDGLMREDLFTVVFEQVHTDTCPYADIILPATTFLETYDIRKSYGTYVLGGIVPTIEAAGLSRSNHSVFAELGRAMGFQDEAFRWSDEEAFEKVASNLTLPDGDKPDLEELKRGGIVRARYKGETPIQFKTAFPDTADGKIHLTPEVLGPNPYQYQSLEVEGYPLALISPASGKLITSSLGEYNLPKLETMIHPDDAKERGIEQGDSIRVYNDLGEVICTAKVTTRIARGVACMPKGAWRKASQNGMTSTALCPTTVNVVGGAACFNDARVEIAKA